MICPFCNANDDKVIDSRPTEGGAVIRRRRVCQKCDRRFSTYERVEQASRLMVVKKDGASVPFSTENIVRGVSNACGKRPIPEDIKRQLAEQVEEELHAEFEREVSFGTPPALVVHQCGSGVTACHNMLAMAHAGLEGSPRPAIDKTAVVS